MTQMERGAAVRTARADESERAVLIAEQYEILAEHAAPHRLALELSGETDRMPIAPHHSAAGRAGSDSS